MAHCNATVAQDVDDYNLTGFTTPAVCVGGVDGSGFSGSHELNVTFIMAQFTGNQHFRLVIKSTYPKDNGFCEQCFQQGSIDFGTGNLSFANNGSGNIAGEAYVGPRAFGFAAETQIGV